VFTVTRRVFGKAADGRTVLRFISGDVITEDEARAAGLLHDEPRRSPEPQAEPATEKRETVAKPLARMKLAELRAVCEAEEIDATGANLRAEYIEAIEAARAERAFEAGPGDGS